VRNLLLIALILLTATSCATLKPAKKPAAKTFTSGKISSNSSASVNLQFINGMEMNQEKKAATTNKQVDKIVAAENRTIPTHSSIDIERALPIHFIYAAKLGVDVESITNFKLFQTIDEWWGTPYRMGGSTKKGIDCSAFVNTLMLAVYAINLPRTSREQYEAAAKIDDADLDEGDLVFFNTRGGISHVGVYLVNNKFVHASTSGGVMISDLNEAYWKARYKGAGRIK